ncbi:MAG: cell division protein FtsX [Magnetospiraceae bacterium]
MIGRRLDVPLGQDAADRFLPWLVAFMVFLAALALAGVLLVDTQVGAWRSGTTATLTVQIAPAENEAVTDRKVDVARDFLRSRPEVARVRPIPAAEAAAILEPWLGPMDGFTDLPIPRLIDVELLAGSRGTLPDLTKRLATAVPGASVEDHGQWLERFVTLARAAQGLAGMVLIFIAIATVGTAVFTTRAGLSVHHEVIEVLHLIGAEDTYIAKQFSYHAMVMAFRGGILGLVLAVPTLLILGRVAASLETMFLPTLAMDAGHWLALGSLPLLAAGVAWVTAWITVRHRLGTLP